MANLQTEYLGLKLKNPVIVSSSGLTDSVEKIIKLEQNGAGAVVLKSLFEEQINIESGRMIESESYPEAMDYIFNYTKNNSVEGYLNLIEQTKKKANIPVIASINCISASDWVSFAKKIESAGADALELNAFFVPNDKLKSSEEYETLYYNLIEKIKVNTKLPVAVKLGPHFTNLISLVKNLYYRGAAGVVLFNRFFSPDIDINKMKFTTSDVLSYPSDIRQSLRWVGIIAGLNDTIDISASTGIHDGEAAIKHILAGAKTIQICSVLYRKGPEVISEILNFIETWMKKNNIKSLNEIRGKMSYKNVPDPSVYERAQFMKYFSDYQ